MIDGSASARFEEHEMTVKTSAPITGETHEARLAECKRQYQAAFLTLLPKTRRR
jgi:hypothetical protein